MPILAKDKLCRLVLAYGDSILSETCTTFPREVHRFADHEEDTLMPGCPAVIDLWRHKEITFPSVVHSNAGISSENTWTNVSEHTMCVEKDENKMAFLIREHILALLGDHTVSIEEALLESFYILLELYKKSAHHTGTGGRIFFSGDTAATAHRNHTGKEHNLFAGNLGRMQ